MAYVAQDQSARAVVTETMDATTEADAKDEAMAWMMAAYDPENRTYWVIVALWSGDDESHVARTIANDDDSEPAEMLDKWKMAIHPDVPQCENPEGHSWDVGPVYQSASGLGTVQTDTCETCGLRRTTDYGAVDIVDGEGGLHSVAFEAEL